MTAQNSKSATGASGKTGGAQTDAKPKLMSGGNPQIAKAEGDAPV